VSEALVQVTVTSPLAGDDVVADARALVITGPETAEMAVEFRDGVQALLAEIEGAYRPHIQRANLLHKGLCAELRERQAPATQALLVVNAALSVYEIDRRKRAEAVERERQRREAEAAAEEREAEAKAVETVDPTMAAQIRTTPLSDFAMPIAQPAPVEERAKGVAVSVPYVAELTDLAALVDFAAKNPAMMALVLQPNQQGLDLLVKQHGASFSIPGVKRVAGVAIVRRVRR
jgi:hypothetical protein